MRRKSLMLAICLTPLLTACAHNDVLVFGTDTALALDVQTAAGQGGSPSLTLGYKRKEAVWMPLVVNGRDSTVVPCARTTAASCVSGAETKAILDDPKYKSSDTIQRGDGVVETRTDAYSVFASLGAKFSGDAKTGEASAAGGLAQFFATGVAAINISQNEALVTALKVESPGGSAAQAGAVEAVANRSAASLGAAVSASDMAANGKLAAPVAALQERRANLVLACATDKTGAYRWSQLVDATDYPVDDKAIYAKFPAAKLHDELRRNPSLTKKALAVGTAAPFNCAGE